MKRLPISTAFETSADDVYALLQHSAPSISFQKAEELFDNHVLPHAGPGGRIERAALRGNDLDDQTEYAHEEISNILKEAGIISIQPSQESAKPQ